MASGTDTRLSLHERESELSAIETALDGLAKGRRTSVLAEGPAGIGKSALLAAAEPLAAERGVVAVSARASELEAGFPFGIVRQMLERRVREPGDNELFGGPAAAAEAVFGAEPAPDGVDAHFAVLQGLYWLVLGLAADRPHLLIVDDVQWADTASLRFLAFVSRRLEDTGVGLLIGLRTSEPGTDPALIAELTSDPDIVPIRPSPLGVEATEALIVERLEAPCEPEFRDACLEATGGNPLLLHHLLGTLAADGVTPTGGHARRVAAAGPRAVGRTVSARLGRLPSDDTTVAQAVAVLGEHSDVATVSRLIAGTFAEVGEATGRLADAEILARSTTLTFAHPLIRTAVYESMPPATRQIRHAEAAELLAESGAAPERTAAQLLLAPPVGEPWAAEALWKAADDARSRGAPDSAVAILRRLLAEPLELAERSRALLRLGRIETDIDGESAIEHMEEALAGPIDDEDRARATIEFARTLMFRGMPERGAQIARAMAEQLPEGDPHRTANLAVAMIATYFGVDVPESAQTFARYRSMTAPLDPGEKVMAGCASFDWMMREGTDRKACTDLAAAALEDDEIFDWDNGMAWVGALQVLVFGERPEAEDVIERAGAYSRRRGSTFHIIATNLFTSLHLLYRGDLQRAENLIADNYALCVAWGSNVFHTQVGVTLRSLVDQGRLEEARACVDRYGAPDGIAQEGTPVWTRGALELQLAERRPEDVLALLEQGSYSWVEQPGLLPLRDIKARALDQLGRTDEAIELIEEQLTTTRRWGAPGSIGRTLRILGTLRRDAGRQELEEAVEVLEASVARLELAHAHASLGGLIRRSGAPSDARPSLMRAYELAESCGAGGLAADVRTELRASGVRPRSSALSGPASLTASERRVADMAASGATNREIAQALFVTPKTVEVHLSSAYRKLDIGSRRELPQALDSGEPAVER